VVPLFWANVSHELRTPLNSIIGLTRLLAEPAPGGAVLDSERLYQVELIRNSGGTLLTLVNDLLDVAKAESGQLHVDPAQVDLPALFGRLRGLARPMAQGKPVEVIVSADGDPNTPVTILTDEVALTSILRNLLSNGIKYTDHGEVRLSARVAGPRLEISVADTGIGIPAGLHDHVFEEFYQVPGLRRGGTGLGLPYARRLAAILGGDLTLTSEPEELLAVVMAALRYSRARQRAERTAALLTALTGVALDINTAETFDGLARAAAAGAARIFTAQAVLMVEMPDGQLVQLVALAAEALRSYAEEHIIALTLQRSLLPPAPPEIPGLAIAFRYLPASDQAEVGGDFSEALRWRDRVLVAIGDVQGHSLQAATVMGELRYALRAFILEGHSPLAITGLVNEVLTRYHPGIIATLCLAVLDPASGELQIVNCGHMAPLLVSGQAACYAGEGGLLLGLPREAFSNHLMSIFGPREDDVAMIAVRRTGIQAAT